MNTTPELPPIPAPEASNFRNLLGIQEPGADAVYVPQTPTQALDRHVGYRLDRPERSDRLAQEQTAQPAGDSEAVARAASADQEFRRFGAAFPGSNEQTAQFRPVRADTAVSDTVVTRPLFPTHTGVLDLGEVEVRRPHTPTLNRARRAVTRAAVSQTVVAPPAPEPQRAIDREGALAQARADFLNAPQGYARDMAKIALRKANADLLEARRQEPVPKPKAESLPKKAESFDWFGNAS